MIKFFKIIVLSILFYILCIFSENAKKLILIDIMMEIRARSLDDLHKIVTGSIGQIEGVVRTETLIEMKTFLQDPSFDQV